MSTSLSQRAHMCPALLSTSAWTCPSFILQSVPCTGLDTSARGTQCSTDTHLVLGRQVNTRVQVLLFTSFLFCLLLHVEFLEPSVLVQPNIFVKEQGHFDFWVCGRPTARS